jgi:hypothetical protein
MRFPVRLTAVLTLGMAARALRAHRHHPLILKLAPESVWKPLRAPARKFTKVHENKHLIERPQRNSEKGAQA